MALRRADAGGSGGRAHLPGDGGGHGDAEARGRDGGIEPAVAANGAGLWLAGGPGGPPGVAWVRPGTEVPATVFQGAVHSSVAWLSAVGDEVWAGVEAYGTGPSPLRPDHPRRTGPGRPRGRDLSLQIDRSSLHGSTPGAGLWGLAAIGPCGHPAELLEVDPSTGSSHPSVALPAPAQACDDAGEGSQLAAVGRDVFALIPTGVAGSAVLYRAAT